MLSISYIQLDSEIILIVDGKTDLGDLPDITNKLLSSRGGNVLERKIKQVYVGGGALTMINVEEMRRDDILKLSGWASLIWVSVSKDNLEKTLTLMDSTITKKVNI